MRKATRLYVLTVAIWFLACGGWVTWHLYTYAPPAGDQDFYTHNWGFQLIVTIIFHLPLWIIALLLIIAFEAALIARARDRRGTGNSPGNSS